MSAFRPEPDLAMRSAERPLRAINGAVLKIAKTAADRAPSTSRQFSLRRKCVEAPLNSKRLRVASSAAHRARHQGAGACTAVGGGGCRYSATRKASAPPETRAIRPSSATTRKASLMAAMLVRTRARLGRLICGLRGLGGLLEQKTERGSEPSKRSQTEVPAGK